MTTENDNHDEDQQLTFPFYEETSAGIHRDFSPEVESLEALPKNEEISAAPQPPENSCSDAVGDTPAPKNRESSTGSGEASEVSQELVNTAPCNESVEATDSIETSMEPEEDSAEISVLNENAAAEKSTTRKRKKDLSFPPLNEITIRRAVLGFLAAMRPDGIGLDFPLGVGRLRADAGSYFMASIRKKMTVTRTILVLSGVNRDIFRVDIAKEEALRNELSREQSLRIELEQRLRVEEPELKKPCLFSEIEEWDFSATRNHAYKDCLRNIERLELALKYGNKFERLMLENTADEYYLAVPVGLVQPEEIPEKWGFAIVQPDFSVTVVRPAQVCGSTPEKRMDFALRAASATVENAMFVNGVTLAGKTPEFRQLPKKRKAYRK